LPPLSHRIKSLYNDNQRCVRTPISWGLLEDAVPPASATHGQCQSTQCEGDWFRGGRIKQLWIVYLFFEMMLFTLNYEIKRVKKEWDNTFWFSPFCICVISLLYLNSQVKAKRKKKKTSKTRGNMHGSSQLTRKLAINR
jgi:hypothetical protein